MKESDKDWHNPAFFRVYSALAMADFQAQSDTMMNWLNANGFANLTCCPVCHVDDFTHVESCPLATTLDLIKQAMVKTGVGQSIVSEIQHSPNILELAEELRNAGMITDAKTPKKQ